MINIAVEHWTYKSVAIDSKVWHIYYIKCGTKNMCHSVAQKCGTIGLHNTLYLIVMVWGQQLGIACKSDGNDSWISPCTLTT